jgi:hypothetical protein
VSCPRYLFEVLTWIGFALVARTWPACAFAVAVGGLLAGWANRRHQRYRHEFDGREGRDSYPTDRQALVPFVS